MSTSPEQAYDQGEVPNARAVAMGGALNALGVSTAALSLNPANMALARVYHLEALAAYSPEAKRQTYGLAIVDSVINSAAHRRRARRDVVRVRSRRVAPRRGPTSGRALAIPLGDYLALGATGRWLHVDQDLGVGPFGTEPTPRTATNGPLFNGVTFDAGATVTPLERPPHRGRRPQPDQPGRLRSRPRRGGRHRLLHRRSSRSRPTARSTSPPGATPAGASWAAPSSSSRTTTRSAAGWRYDARHEDQLAVARPRIHRARSWSIELGARHDLIADHAETLGVLSLRYFYDAAGASPPEQNEMLQ